MKVLEKYDITDVNSLHELIIKNEIGCDINQLYVTGASYIYQTTQFPESQIKYHNYYLLVRVGSYFGACSHTSDQLTMEIAGQLSGAKLKKVIKNDKIPVKIAAIDAFFGVSFPHQEYCKEVVEIPSGTPIQRANARDELIAKMAGIEEYQRVALIGVVNPLVEAIKDKGGKCLPCDLQLTKTQSGDIVEKDMEKVLDKADSIICTAMTLSNGTFDRIIEVARIKKIPLTVYAQTGSAVVAPFVGRGVTSLIAEPFPFTQFSSMSSQIYCYY